MAHHVLPTDTPIALAQNSRVEVRLEAGHGQITGTLSPGGGQPGQGRPTILFPVAGSHADDHCNTKPAIGFTATDNGADALENLSPTLRAHGISGVAHDKAQT
ncbi:DNA-cytosine methyltransferase [Granulibacter bethesdensis]|uniref:DNA-cytosine methyltransferase n=1 Tax=Granulibacter bethesdensis TaxID=364410 RepID=A0AAC9KCQ5_9PROT|nr:hypothetical protein [Granulibacter bethesdensis]APH53618.1 DNA-cytosine methyltransferase [Granulibacter bethesdensis]APH61196.1 DNA-cytosine methyltransferase [Granulibacter bethesdensis]